MGDGLLDLSGRKSFLGVFYCRCQLVWWTTFFIHYWMLFGDRCCESRESLQKLIDVVYNTIKH